MSDHLPPSGGSGPEEERVWDEYDWERFLQQQDRKTEKYMELLEKYLDDPHRDQIIAREMGWHHLLDENGKDWGEDLDALFTREMAEIEGVKDNGELAEQTPGLDEHERHPLYQLANSLMMSVESLFAGRKAEAEVPCAVKLRANATLAAVKLAAALGDDDIDEIGMTIAYLKRALKAVTTTLEAALECEEEDVIDGAQAQALRQRIFQVRDGTINLMGEYRGEWRRRFER